MLPSDSGAGEAISSNSNANFQPKQNIKHGIAKYSKNHNTIHMDVTTSRIFLVMFQYYCFAFDTINTTMTKYATVSKNEYQLYYYY